MLGKLFNNVDRELNEGESPYLFGYPDDDCPEPSPYYWWFQYLKRNDDYLACCERGGEGEHADLYLDWGDVRTDDFDKWFYMHGDMLFREPHVPDKLTEIQSASELDGIDWSAVMVVVNPIRIGSKVLSKRDIKRQFSMMVDAKFATKKAGRPAYESGAKYRIVGYPKLKALKEMLHVYDLHKAEPKLTLWRIGERLLKEGKLTIAKNAVTDPSLPQSFGENARNVMTATISRHLKKAEAYIKSSTGQFFPVKPADDV
ncbi:hypothetical protein [Janthinobacterium sp. PAMC25594]|uniref:hypothetical protein n=1 Tax=Janthinobacterium sp. PAMC25594 TaxID=2861284 RepID=UPI001C63836B|nr:hypothetical protein [Janthinobacterium sp. PAMC25594]QYG05637.1 hypothetical protein KY494_20300 [Janthinobacterium sp. PAMC25594]